MACGTTHQVAGTWRTVSPQVAHRFEAFQKALPRVGLLQSSAVAQSVAHGHVAAFDSFGRLATCSMQSRPDVLSAGAGGRHGLHLRLMVISRYLVRNHPGALDRLTEEGLGTCRIAVLTQQEVDDHAVFVDLSVQVAFVVLAEQEHLVDHPPPTKRLTVTSHFGSQLRSERLDPVEDSAVRDIDAALS
jgi:hypothetical protein